MPVGGGLPVDGAAQLEVLNYRLRPEVKVLVDKFEYDIGVYLPVPKASMETDKGQALPMT